MSEFEPTVFPVWKRQKMEGRKAYEAFLRYRDLGSERTVAAAIPPSATAATGKARGEYCAWWRRWSAKWHWRERAEAWDEYLRQAADDATFERVLEEKARAHQELQTWRDRQLRAHVATQEAGIMVVTRLLDLASSGLIKNLPWERRKVTSIVTLEDGRKVTTETIEPGIGDLLDLALTALQVGQRMERIQRGENPEGDADVKKATAALLSLVREFVPEERVEELAARVAEIAI
jgi:hypothetical protein